jgi:hypothetical protein
MAFFGLFGKKKKEEFLEEPGLPQMGKEELGLPGLEERAPMPEEQAPIGAPPGMGMPGFTGAQQRAQPMPQQPMEREYEVLSAKLDALKAVLDSINQRLEIIERIARGEYETRY